MSVTRLVVEGRFRGSRSYLSVGGHAQVTKVSPIHLDAGCLSGCGVGGPREGRLVEEGVGFGVHSQAIGFPVLCLEPGRG